MNVVLRDLEPGDLGWIIHRQAILYAEEYGLNCEFEALLARICADFIKSYNTDREMVWIAEVEDQVVGSVFLMQDNDPSEARLRLLYVEPNIRGAGVGSILVTACIERARAIGYRRLILWTDSTLSAARRLYARQGFVKVAEQAHTSFGQELIGETWSLDLRLSQDS